MRKKFLGLIALVISSFGLIAGVNAAGVVNCDGNEIASTGGVCYDDLQAAISGAGAGDTVELHQSITASGYITIGTRTLDLKENSITFTGGQLGLYVYGKAAIMNGTIISEDNSAGAAAVSLGTNNADATLSDITIEGKNQQGIVLMMNDTKLTLKAGTKVTAYNNATIAAFGTQASHHTLVVESGAEVYNLGTTKKYAAINGSYSNTVTLDMTIENGAKVSSVNGPAILQMAKGNVTISGEVSGYEAAVAITKGSLTVNEGAVLTATGVGESDTYKPSEPNKIYPNGAAIYIDPYDTVAVDIKGGTITSDQGYAISAPATDTQNQKLDIKIEKGTFEGAKGGIEINEDTTRESFIEAGTVFTKGGEPDNSVLKYTEDLEISASGVVGKVNTITKGTVSKGTIDVVANAAEGETVVVKVKAYAGYEVSNVTVKGAAKVYTVTKNADGSYSFEMPEESVTVSAEFVEKTSSKPAEDDNIVVEEEVKGDENVTLSTEANDILKESLLNTDDEELKELLGSNENVTIVLENEKITKDDMPKEELEKFEKAVEGATVTEFFELDIVVKVDGKDNHYLTELNKPITLTIDLPELPEVAKGYARKYYILREHDGVVEKLDATLTEDGKLSFATDKFSKYAIAYVDEEIKDSVADKNPSTIDNVMAYVSMAIASIGALGVTSKKFLKK